MWYVRGIYGAKSANDVEWVAVRDRVARTLTRMRATANAKSNPSTVPHVARNVHFPARQDTAAPETSHDQNEHKIAHTRAAK